MSKLNLFFVTNMYPSLNSQKGIFVKELVDCIRVKSDVGQISVFNIDKGSSGFKKYIFSIIPLFRCLSQGKFDLINVHFGLSFVPMFFLLPYLWFKKVKIVLTLHGSDLMGGKVVNTISNLAILFSDKSIVVSPAMVSYVWEISLKKLSVIPCGVNDCFEFIERPSWNVSQEIKMIFPSSPLRPEKNYKLFSKVVLLLKSKGVIVNEIHFDGLNRLEIMEALSKANLLFLSSIREGSPQVVKEAVLTGLPVVSTNVGDVADILDGISGEKSFISSNPDEIVDWILKGFSGSSIDQASVNLKHQCYSNSYLSQKVINEFKRAVG